MANVPLLQPGAVLQVVQSSVDIQATTTGSSYIQTGLKCQITPKTITSKFEVKGTALINSRTNGQGMTAKIMVRNVSTSSAWVDFAMASGCDSHGIGGYTSTETDHWLSSGFALYGTPGLAYTQGQILEFEVWFRGAGIGTAGSTTSRFGHPGRTSNMVITEIY
jgi:hypothetical protein